MGTQQADGRRAWTIAAMLSVFYVINFFDKVVLSVSAVPLMQEMHFSSSQYGMVASSFFVLYALSGLLTGIFVINRTSTKLLLVVLVAIWSFSEFALAFSSSLLAMFGSRVLLGIGEGPGNGTAIHCIYGWFTNAKRSLPTAVFICGGGVGVLVGAPLLSWVVEQYSWRDAILVCGAVGVAWMCLWWLFGAEGPLLPRSDRITEGTFSPRVPWVKFWLEPTMTANFGIAAISYWATALSFTWLAPYLRIGLGYNAQQSGWLLSVIVGSQVVLHLFVATLSDRLLAAGFSSRVARGVPNGACLLIAGISLIAVSHVASPVLQIVLLTAAFALPYVTFIIGPAIVGQVAPPAQRGTALLTNYTVITLAGLLASMVAGGLVEAAGADHVLEGYMKLFWLTGGLLIGAGLWGVLALNPEKALKNLQRGAVQPLMATFALK